MYLTNVKKYICDGVVFEVDKKSYVKNIIAPILLAILCGVVPGIILKSYWMFMTILLLIIALCSFITVVIISSKVFTLKRCLILDLIITSTWVGVISVLELMIFSIWKGFHIAVLLLYMPIVFVPLLIGMKINKQLMSSENSSKDVVHSGIKVIGGHAGIIGMNFAAIFRNVDQSVAFVIILIGLTILNCCMSLGLLSIQKLYYLKKYNISERIE